MDGICSFEFFCMGVWSYVGSTGFDKRGQNMDTALPW